MSLEPDIEDATRLFKILSRISIIAIIVFLLSVTVICSVRYRNAVYSTHFMQGALIEKSATAIFQLYCNDVFRRTC